MKKWHAALAVAGIAGVIACGTGHDGDSSPTPSPTTVSPTATNSPTKKPTVAPSTTRPATTSPVTDPTTKNTDPGGGDPNEPSGPVNTRTAVHKVKTTAPVPPKVVTPVTEAPAANIVHPGAYCSPTGSHGETSAGTRMVCSKKAGDSHARWRSA